MKDFLLFICTLGMFCIVSRILGRADRFWRRYYKPPGGDPSARDDDAPHD